MRSLISKTIRRGFIDKQTRLFSSAELQNLYILEIKYDQEDGYYQTYEHRREFSKEVNQLQTGGKCKVIGGDLYPKSGTSLIINCNSEVVIQQFINSCIYKRKGLIKNWQIREVQRNLSSQKFQKIWNFYQPKLQ